MDSLQFKTPAINHDLHENILSFRFSDSNRSPIDKQLPRLKTFWRKRPEFDGPKKPTSQNRRESIFILDRVSGGSPYYKSAYFGSQSVKSGPGVSLQLGTTLTTQQVTTQNRAKAQGLTLVLDLGHCNGVKAL